MVIPRKKLLVLGARGRLGKAFIDRHSKSFEIIEFGSKERLPQGGREYHSQISSLMDLFVNNRPDLIMNLAAVWAPSASKDEIWQAGYEFPKRVLGLIKEEDPCVGWIQVDSYYNLHFDLFGVDKDHYSRTKRIFFELLEKSTSQVAPVQVIAPHLVGPSEPANRFFRVLTEGIFNRQLFHLGSSNTLLPYLHLTDAADQLLIICQTPSLRDPARISMKVSGQARLIEIVSSAHQQFGALQSFARFDRAPRNEGEFHAPMSFGSHESLPEPKHDLNFILAEQWNERIGEKEKRN